MAKDLYKNHEVTSVDKDNKALENLKIKGIKTIEADLSNAEGVKSVVKDFDLVINAVPGFMGFNTLKGIIEAGRNVVDISFFSEDAFELDALAKEKGVIAITDCGVAPGMCNIILGYHNARMQVNKYECLVGGLPMVREWPFEYKAVFSPIDVIEEYIRPARYMENGQIIIKEALSDTELLFFENIGTLESFNTDGLRSLIHTMKIPDMIEKTMRYPGTINYIRALRESGFFSHEPLEINGVEIRPVDVTAKLLYKKWKLKPGEEDFTIMRITIEGMENNKPKKYVYELLDHYEKASSTLSMARSTGYTCTAVANLVLDGKFTQKGICPPEFIGPDEDNFKAVMSYLQDRGVVYKVASE